MPFDVKALNFHGESPLLEVLERVSLQNSGVQAGPNQSVAMSKPTSFSSWRLLLFICLSFIYINAVQGQISWTQTNGPYNGDVERLFLHPNDGRILALADGQVYRGIPPGPFWSPVIFTPDINYWYDLEKAGDLEYYLIGAFGGLGHTSDFGITWDQTTLPVSDIQILKATPDGRALIYTGSNDFYFTEDHGDTWVLKTSDLGINVLALLYDSSTDFFFAGTAEGIWASADNGSTWTAMNNGDMSNSITIRFLHRIDQSGTLLASTNSKTYRSIDGGINWTLLPGNLFIRDMDDLGPDAVYAACGFSGLYRSSVDGLQWKPVEGPGLPEQCQLVTVKNGTGEIYISGADKEGLLVAADPMDPEWTIKGLPNEAINALHYDDVSGTILAATDDTLFRSTDMGQSWIRSNTGLMIPLMTGFTTKPGKIYCWSTFGSINSSSDAGISWNNLSANVPGSFIHDMATTGSVRLFLASSGNDPVYVATNQDQIWAPFAEGLPDQSSIEKLEVAGAPGPDQVLFGASVFGVYHTSAWVTPANWESFGNGLPGFQSIYDLAASPSGNTIFLSGENGLFQSSTTVDFWAALPFPIDALPVLNILVVDDEHILAATATGIYISQDGGQTWDASINSLADVRTTCLAAAGKDQWLAGTIAGGVHLGTGKIVAVDDQHSPTPDIRAFPNPASDRIELSGHFLPSDQWIATDLLGRPLYLTSTWSEERVILDVSPLHNGLWWIRHDQHNIPVLIQK